MYIYIYIYIYIYMCVCVCVCVCVGLRREKSKYIKMNRSTKRFVFLELFILENYFL